MKQLIDIHVVLSTPEDLSHWEEQAEEASDKLNDILFRLYEKADEDIAVEQLEAMLQQVWENWLEDKYLLDIDEDDMADWVDHFLATWDDATSSEH